MGRDDRKIFARLILPLAIGAFIMSYPADAQKSNEPAAGAQGTKGRMETGSASMKERGRYLIKISGCNDCHTDRYIELEGAVPEKQWLKGSNLGWHGPWGTTYAVNLRRFLTALTEDQWVDFARTVKTRPPMAWWGLREMHDEDLRAIHTFVKYLGPDGVDAPSYLTPDRMPKQPYVQFPMPPK
jgi:mono/diheme cytochrome c family protein